MRDKRKAIGYANGRYIYATGPLATRGRVYGYLSCGGSDTPPYWLRIAGYLATVPGHPWCTVLVHRPRVSNEGLLSDRCWNVTELRSGLGLGVVWASTREQALSFVQAQLDLYSQAHDDESGLRRFVRDRGECLGLAPFVSHLLDSEANDVSSARVRDRE